MDYEEQKQKQRYQCESAAVVQWDYDSLQAGEGQFY